MNDLIHIIIPVYNHTRALRQALASIADQTYRPLQVTIVDDGSVPAVPDGVVPNFTDIFWEIIRQNNSGAPSARNRGLVTVSAPYVIFWDADVIAKPRMLSVLHDALGRHVEASYAYCNFTFGVKKMKARAFDLEELKKRNFIHSTSLLRLRDALSWDETLQRLQDWDYWLTLAKYKKTGVYVPENLFRVIPRKKGMSTWLPRFAYKAPFRYAPWVNKRVQAYEASKKIILQKHGLV